MQAETPVGRHVNCPLLLPGILIFNFWCFLHVSKLWISLQEDGFIKSYNSVFYMHHVEYCDQYARFDLQVCFQIVMRMIYRNKRNVCLFVCVCVGGGGLRTVCDVTYRIIWQRTVHLIPEHVTCFGTSNLLVLIPSFFTCTYSISPFSFVLRAPFYDTLPRPTNTPPPGLRNCLSAANFHSEVIRYSDNWM